MQFEVLCISRDLPARPPLPRPSFHPPTFHTFEQGIGGSPAFPNIGVEPRQIVRLGTTSQGSGGRHFTWGCVFCNYPRSFERITTYWAHLRAEHQHQPHAELLQQVTESARAYQAWADERFFDYKRDNANTWQKMVQAQSSEFDWDVFTSWRLPKTRIYQGRAPLDNVIEEGSEQGCL